MLIALVYDPVPKISKHQNSSWKKISCYNLCGLLYKLHRIINIPKGTCFKSHHQRFTKEEGYYPVTLTLGALPNPAVVVGILLPSSFEMGRNPAMHWVTYILGCGDQYGEYDKCHHSPAMTQAIVHVIIISDEQGRDVCQGKGQFMPTHSVDLRITSAG